MTTIEALRQMGLMKFIESKGHLLSAYRHEILEIQKESERLSIEVQKKEKEYDNYYAELHSLRDQLQMSEKYISEVKVSKATVTQALEQMRVQKNSTVKQEASNRSEIEAYRIRFEEVKNLIAAGPEWTPEQIEVKNALEKERDFLQSKYENKMLSVISIRSEVETLYDHVHNIEEEIAKIEKDTEIVDEKLKNVTKQTKAENKQREMLEKEIFQKRDDIKTIEDEILERKKTLKFEEKSLHDLELNLKDIRHRMEECIAEYNKLYHTLESSTNELERQKQHILKFEEEIKEKEEYNKMRKQEIEQLDKETSKLIALREVVSKKISETETEKNHTEELRDNLMKEISTYETVEFAAIHKDREAEEKNILNCKKQIDIITKKAKFQEKSIISIDELIDHYNTNIKAMNVDLENHKNKLVEYESTIESLILEKERYDTEIENVSKRFYTALEELKLQDIQVRELQKKIHDDNTKLRHKQNSYESVRSDRNLFSRQLIESQEQITELKKSFRIINYTIEQLKDEISIKDHAIVKEHFLHHAVDKERELIRNELIKINKQITASEAIIDNQDVEIAKLNRIIEEARQEHQRQVKEFQYIRNEKNILTSQIIKRNMEISNTYDMIKLQRGNLLLGEKKYVDICLEINSCRQELKDLILSNNDTMSELKQLNAIKMQAIQLNKELLNEKIKTSLLERELDKPMNIHRWRILEASDPQRFEKITQIHSLQKQLVVKSDQLVELNLLIQEKEKVYLELKNIIARQPGAEAEEQLLIYQQTYKDKSKQLEAMEEELQMYREQIRVFKDDIQVLDDQMDSMKKQWIKRKLMEENSGRISNQ